MAALKRNRRTWFLILILGVGFFALRERQGLAAGDLTITLPSTFASLDGSASDADGTVNGVLTVNGNLTIASGGSITCNDPSAPSTDSACPIRLAVSGNMEIQAGGSILAENNVGTGSGGNIEINVGGNLTLRAAGVDPGALISSRKNAGTADLGIAGNITITLGNSNFAMEPGSQILANSTRQAGAIVIDGARAADVEGRVESRSTATGTGATQAPGGGPITINAGCSLSVGDAGVVSSQGSDPGADLVHLQSCNVTIDGLVQSTGPGFAIPNNPPNHCDSVTRPDKPSNSTACVEIWGGDSVTIDSTSTHAGQVNADIGTSGGASGRSWIDVFSRGSITILGDTVAPFAVHANMTLANGHAGAITILSQSGAVATGGLAVQASDQTTGSAGGSVVIQAGGPGSPAGNVNLGTAAIEARGAASGASPAGGQISARSFNAAVLGAAPGSLNASGDGAASPGAITLEACTAVSYTGTVTPAATILTPFCGGAPAFQAYVSLPAGCVAACASPTPTPTDTPTSVPTPVPTSPQTMTPTSPPTNTPTSTRTSTPTRTPSNTRTSTPTRTPTNTPTSTPIPTCGAAVSGTTTICKGSATTIQADLTGTGPWTLTWSDGFTQTAAASPATRSVSPNATTTYTVTKVTTADCDTSGSGSAVVTVEKGPKASVSGDTTICEGSSATIQAALTGTPPWNLVWSDGFVQTVSASPATRTVSPTTTTVYTVTDLSDAVCSAGTATGNARVKVQAIPSSAITAPASVCANSSGNKALVPSAGGGATYAWSISNGTITSGAGSRIMKFTAGGPAGSSVSITVTVTTSAGCTSTSTIIIPINC